MATPQLNVDDIVATTIENRSKKAADNVTRQNALLSYLSRGGRVRPIDGGTKIVQEIEYALNGTASWYAGYEVLNISPQNIFSWAEYPIKQAAVSVTISGLEELMNSGEERMIELLGGRIENAERSLRTLIASGLYSDGTLPKQIGGLRYLIDTTPATGSVGGIDPSVWTFWQNIAYSATANGGAAATSANIRRYMDAVYNQLITDGGAVRPNVLVADNNYWELYNQNLQAIQRIETVSTGEGGFERLKYRSADVILDGGFQGYSDGGGAPNQPAVGGAPSNTMYFINTDFLYYRPHRDRNFTLIGRNRQSVNQDATVRLMGWAGNVTMSNRRMQGVLFA
jgi:hypothetical protein